MRVWAWDDENRGRIESAERRAVRHMLSDRGRTESAESRAAYAVRQRKQYWDE
jgi:hypothetical protein